MSIADDPITTADHPRRHRASWARTFAGVFVAVWCTYTEFGLVVPMIPRLVTGNLHGSATLVGAAFATAAVVALLLRTFGGQLAQRFGTRSVMTLGAAIALPIGIVHALPLGAPGLLPRESARVQPRRC